MSGNSFRAARIVISRNVSAFAEEVCSHGYLTREGYEGCLSQAAELLSEVRIEIKIRHTVSEDAFEEWQEEIPSLEVEKLLFTDGIIKFQKGDYITIILKGRPAGLAGLAYRSRASAGFRIETGGVIRDEIEPVRIDLP